MFRWNFTARQQSTWCRTCQLILHLSNVLNIFIIISETWPSGISDFALRVTKVRRCCLNFFYSSIDLLTFQWHYYLFCCLSFEIFIETHLRYRTIFYLTLFFFNIFIFFLSDDLVLFCSKCTVCLFLCLTLSSGLLVGSFGHSVFVFLNS